MDCCRGNRRNLSRIYRHSVGTLEESLKYLVLLLCLHRLFEILRRSGVSVVSVCSLQDVSGHSEPAEGGARSAGSPVQNAAQGWPHRAAATVS